MMNKKIEEISEIELKAYAYDLINELSRIQRLVSQVNQEFQRRTNLPKDKLVTLAS